MIATLKGMTGWIPMTSQKMTPASWHVRPEHCHGNKARAQVLLLSCMANIIISDPDNVTHATSKVGTAALLSRSVRSILMFFYSIRYHISCSHRSDCFSDLVYMLERVVQRISVPSDYARTILDVFRHVTSSRVHDVFHNSATGFLGCLSISMCIFR